MSPWPPAVSPTLLPIPATAQIAHRGQSRSAADIESSAADLAVLSQAAT